MYGTGRGGGRSGLGAGPRPPARARAIVRVRAPLPCCRPPPAHPHHPPARPRSPAQPRTSPGLTSSRRAGPAAGGVAGAHDEPAGRGAPRSATRAVEASAPGGRTASSLSAPPACSDEPAAPNASVTRCLNVRCENARARAAGSAASAVAAARASSSANGPTEPVVRPNFGRPCAIRGGPQKKYPHAPRPHDSGSPIAGGLLSLSRCCVWLAHWPLAAVQACTAVGSQGREARVFGG
jgi:hypothetical protein